MSSPDVHRVVAEVWRRESATVVGVLTRLVRDLGLAEELAQDALLAALEEWPRTGLPDRPGAWLLTTARNRALNTLKRRRMAERKHESLRHAPEAAADSPLDRLEAAMDDDVGDEALRLVFTACHPVLAREARVALTLRLVGGLTTDEIARAFLVPEPTVAQRIVRAKRALADAGVPFEVPRGDALGPRLASVLEVVYLVFNEGYAATAGDALIRVDLVREALRLGDRLAALAPEEPEVHGLLALMRLQASRADARTDAAGDAVLLMDQDRTRWDRALLDAGLDALDRAQALAGDGPNPTPEVLGPSTSGAGFGPFALQAAIAACHARARAADETDWKQIAALYGDLARRLPSPVVELNRAVAVSRAEGPAAGLALIDALAGSPALARYPLLPGARADLLVRLGRLDEARVEFERAASLTENTRQRQRLLVRAAGCARDSTS